MRPHVANQPPARQYWYGSHDRSAKLQPEQPLTRSGSKVHTYVNNAELHSIQCEGSDQQRDHIDERLREETIVLCLEGYKGNLSILLPLSAVNVQRVEGSAERSSAASADGAQERHSGQSASDQCFFSLRRVSEQDAVVAERQLSDVAETDGRGG